MNRFRPPKEVQKEAQEFLDIYRTRKQKCNITRVGITRANQLAKRKVMSLNTIARMDNFFTRHKGNEKLNPAVSNIKDDCGYRSYKAWGGTPGKRWAKRIVEEFK